MCLRRWHEDRRLGFVDEGSQGIKVGLGPRALAKPDKGSYIRHNRVYSVRKIERAGRV